MILLFLKLSGTLSLHIDIKVPEKWNMNVTIVSHTSVRTFSFCLNKSKMVRAIAKGHTSDQFSKNL
jgi:hypothetical protein